MNWIPFKEELPPEGTAFWATDDPNKRGIRMRPAVPITTALGYYPHLKYWREDTDVHRRTSNE